MRKVLALLLVSVLAIAFVGINTNPVVADEAATTFEAADYDTNLPEMAAVRFDAAFGTNNWPKQLTATTVQATSDGGYIVGGMSINDSWVGGAQLVKFDSDFAVEWTHSIETDQYNPLTALYVDGDGDIWVFIHEVVVDDNGTPEFLTHFFFNAMK